MNIEKYTQQYLFLTEEFDCGNFVINNFLKSSDALDENQGITYIMLSDEKNYIIGYYNISVGREKLYKPMGGSVNINYLAIHSKFQRTQMSEYNGKKVYLGDYILRDCEKRVLRLRNEIGIAFVTLNSTKEGYPLYHERNSYEDFDIDMSNFVEESDNSGYKLYKWVDDIIGA
ncbi:hypothetical protein [Clostridium sp. HBUAS56010]|uniref:hypothetical protein n=1 Tax=Clostridium sp. HBUAS56010 TaxID=2571127 RepID=UPI001177E6D3|nr:hypothetical protein [Clostridium sp. HBUAS56010]